MLPSGAWTFPRSTSPEFEAASPRRGARSARDRRVCRTTGFLSLINHGVPEATISRCGKAEAFFALPDEQTRAKTPYPGYPYGYLPPLAEALARSKGVESPPDLKESFNGGPSAPRRAWTIPRRSPSATPRRSGRRRPAGSKRRGLPIIARWRRWRRVMRVFAVALAARGFFRALPDAPISALRALNYPALAQQPAPGQIRAGAHTDYGSLTILLPQPGSRGLEISPEGAGRGSPVAGAFVINIGDLMARWTNDRWVSTLHRVVNPEEAARRRRQSLAFFHQPNWAPRSWPCPLPRGRRTRRNTRRSVRTLSDEQISIHDDVRLPCAIRSTATSCRRWRSISIPARPSTARPTRCAG